MDDEPFVRAHALGNRFEADLLMTALRQEGIPAMLRSFEETPYDGLFVPQKGWGLILVPADQLDRARSLIRTIENDLAARRLYEDPSQVDELLWDQLAQLDPLEVAQRAQVSYDRDRGGFRVPFLGALLCCSPERRVVELIDASADARVDFQLVLVVLHYLLEAENVPLTGRWIGEQDLPGGSLFFQGPHALPSARLLARFGGRRQAFCRALETLGGTPVERGDAAYRLWVLPRIPMLLIFWDGDEEFPAELKFRFDASIRDQIKALDTLWAMLNVLARHLAAVSGGGPQAEPGGS